MANLPKEIVGEIFTIKPEDAIREQTISFHSINPFAYCDSSARLYMASTHISQSLVLCHGDERIIQSGIDHQLGENTFSVKIEEDCYYVGMVQRYRTLNDTEPVELFIFVQTVSGQYDVYNIPYYFSLHQYFGFKYETDKRGLMDLEKGTFLPEGTILADAPSVRKNSGLAFGVNANICLATLPPTAQDGVLISESFAKRMSYRIFETRTLEFGSTKYLLNTYGDENNYRGFPEIGEYINGESLLAVLREHDESMTLCLTSNQDLRHHDTDLDHCVYVKSPGEEVHNQYGTFRSGVVVDIKAWMNPKAKKNNLYTNTLGTTMEHVDKLKYFYREVYEFYLKNIKKEARNRNKREDGSINISERLHSLILDAQILGEVYGDNKRILYSSRYTPLDVFKLEFTIEHYITPTLGSKLSGLNGDKGVIVGIVPDDQMPYSEDGTRADLVMDPTSLASRMNLGRSYEIYFNTAIRKVRDMVRDILTKDPNNKKEAWDTILEFLSIFNTEQYTTYSQASEQEKDEVLNEVMTSELFVLYRISTPKKPHVIVQEIEKSRFKPLKQKIYIPHENKIIQTKSDIMIGPIYTILLSKTPDDGFSSVASGKTNHHGLPGGSGTRKYAFPSSIKAVKIISETEGRHYCSNGSMRLLAEMKDRANSKDTHRLLYANILKSETPGFSPYLIDRNEHKFGGDISLKILNSILNVAGLKITYHKDPLDGYTPECDPRIGFTGKHPEVKMTKNKKK